MRSRLTFSPQILVLVLVACGDEEQAGKRKLNFDQDASLADGAAMPCVDGGCGNGLVLTKTDDELTVDFEAPQGIYVQTCSDELRVRKYRDGQWIKLSDERPWATNGAYTLDGTPHTYVFPGEGCDVIDCVPWTARTVSRTEFVRSPEVSVSADPPVLSTRLAALPLRVELDYFTNDACSGTPETVWQDIHETSALVEPHPLTIQVVNTTAEVRSRFQPCTGDYQIGIKRAHRDPSLYRGRCDAPTCANPPVALPVETSCFAPDCLGTRVDLAPSASDVAYTWDGFYREPTDLNCWEAIDLPLGTALEAIVCFGKASGDWDIEDFKCTSHPFSYGQELLEIRL